MNLKSAILTLAEMALTSIQAKPAAALNRSRIKLLLPEYID